MRFFCGVFFTSLFAAYCAGIQLPDTMSLVTLKQSQSLRYNVGPDKQGVYYEGKTFSVTLAPLRTFWCGDKQIGRSRPYTGEFTQDGSAIFFKFFSADDVDSTEPFVAHFWTSNYKRMNEHHFVKGYTEVDDTYDLMMIPSAENCGSLFWSHSWRTINCPANFFPSQLLNLIFTSTGFLALSESQKLVRGTFGKGGLVLAEITTAAETKFVELKVILQSSLK